MMFFENSDLRLQIGTMVIPKRFEMVVMWIVECCYRYRDLYLLWDSDYEWNVIQLMFFRNSVLRLQIGMKVTMKLFKTVVVWICRELVLMLNSVCCKDLIRNVNIWTWFCSVICCLRIQIGIDVTSKWFETVIIWISECCYWYYDLYLLQESDYKWNVIELTFCGNSVLTLQIGMKAITKWFEMAVVWIVECCYWFCDFGLL